MYQGHAYFYHVAWTKDGVLAEWSGLLNTEHVCSGLVAKQQDKLVDIAHFRGMPSPSLGQMIGFLDDLFCCLATVLAVRRRRKSKRFR